MSFEDQDIQPTALNAERPAQTEAAEAEAQPAPSEMPMVAQAELVPAPEGIQVADASGEAEWLFDALEEEAAEKEEEAYEESDGQEASVEEDTQVEADADASGEASAEATVEAGGAEAAGGAAASSGGISSAWIWGGLAVAGGAAAAGGGGSTTKTPEPPTVTLDTDSGIAGDGITSAATFTVGGLENNTSWEYSTDGGSTWTAGSGSSFEIAADGDYTVVVRQTRGQKVSENSASIDVTLDASAPAIGSSDTANIDENADADSVVYTASVEDATDVTFSLKEGSDEALSIDSASGAVTLAGSPDHETQSSYAFTVVATDAAGNASEQAVTLTVNDLDEIPPEVQSVAGDSTTDTVILTFNEALSNDPLPDASTFTVSQAGNPIAVNSVAVSGTSVVLTLGGDLVAGPVQVVYTPGTGNNVTDVAGNESAGFTQLVVSDGYIRGASIYLDANNDGIAQAGELIEGATTDAKGQVILPDDIEAGTLLIVGGVNMDTGAINKIVIKTKVGNTAANPLTTLVETVKASGGLTDEQAEQVVATGLGITLQAGQSLSTYDPIADTSAEGLAARKAVATVATILASAANTAADTETSDAVVSSVATNIATQLVAAASQPVPSAVTFDEATVTAVLKDSSGAAVGDAAVVQNVTTSVQTIKDAVSVDVIVETQAKATDTVAPDAPDVEVAATSDSGESNSDGVTNDATPTITVSFETDATDGTAVVVGNLVEVLVGGNVVGSATLAAEDIEAGTVDIDVGTFTEGDTSAVARVTDKAGNVSELATAITVSVDTQGPQISSDGIASIDENDGSDVEVYTAAATDANTFEYSLADGASLDLSIDAETGVVTLAGADFESQDSYVFTVVATDVAGNKSERAVTLSINNVDEVAPTITSGATAQAIDENSGAGQVIYTAVADDTADISGGVTFSLADGSDAGVTVNAQTGEVTLTGNPDHETQSSYTFTVVAKDAAGLETEQEVTLDLNDLDESAPTITSGATAAALDENSAADSVVYTATSTDDGDVSTGATTYSLGEGSDQAITINAQTGEVTLPGVADFEQQESYSFVVDATDAAGNKSTQTVTLAINNLDEVAPVITSGDQIAAIDENTASGQVIYTATATDLGDVSDGVTFSLADGTDEALSIDAETGVVTLNESPDFETASSYEFTVVATDGAGNKVDKTLTLAINDLDEGPPQFTSSASVSVDENTSVDTVVYTAAATDFGTVTYSLAPEDESTFTIDSSTGEVRLIASPDFEQQPEYTFTVTATDDSPGANASDLEVTLSVNNLDEADPVITSGGTAAAIDENSGADQVVYSATATDEADVSGGVMFSLAEGSDQALSINAETGAVTLSTNPDHETQSAYSFTVIAKDAAGNSSQQAINLTINDLDEADPVITSADTGVAVDENSAVGTVIYTAVATDDGDVSGGVSFSLSADSAAGVEIDAVSGEVSLTASADFETAESYSFTVVATDVAGNKTTKAVAVDVTNLDEVAPVITSGATAEAIAENTAAGAVVYMATATDEGDISEGVTFSLADGSDAALSINAQTGAVTLNESPDFETQETYSFTVVATDGGDNTDDQAVTLAVSDVDDSQPTFTSATTGAALTSTPYLYQAEVDDSGDDISAGVTYRLADSGDSALLQIDPSDGVVSVKNGLVDPSIQDSYTFTVIADDGVTDPVSQTVTLTVPEPNTVLGLGVSEQGGVQIVDTDNGDGTITLEFFVADEFVSTFPNGVENYDFVINYDATQFEAIAGTDYSTDFALPTVNAEVAGRLVVGAIDLDPLDLATGEPLGQLVLTPITQDSFTISIADVIVNETDLSGTVVTYGDTASVTGSDEPESFILAGGSAQITAGAGVDVFVVTSTTGNDLTITDYTEDDFVDFSHALISAGYNSNTDELTQSASTGEARLLLDPVLSDLTASNSALDNGYGAIVDGDNGDIVTFYDENAAAGSVNVVVSRIAIGDVASTLSQVEIGAQVSTGAAFTSGTTGGSVTENDPNDLLVYTAAVELEEGQSVTFSLAAGVEELFGIDAQTGQVTFIGTADYEAASTLGFTVIATDNEGNASRQSVSIDVVNQDDTAPTWVSGTSFTALANTPFVYAAEATDDADVSLEPVQYSLDPNSADADLLFIDSETGIVTLQQGVLVPGGKQAFTFTVVATDGVNDPVSQQVVASIGATTAVQGTGVLAQGGIQVVDVDNGDGTSTLEFYVDSSVAGQFANGVENYDFVFNYSPDQFEAIAAGDYTTSFSLPTVNDEVAGKLVVGAIDLNALNLADGTPLGSLTVTPLVVDGAQVSVTDVIVNTTDLDSTQIVYGETTIASGTADNDTFTLLGGDTEITGGDGIDAYIVTETTGNQVYITDFMTDEDVIDMSSLLMGKGYNSISDLDLGPAVNGEAREYSQTSMDLLELVQANDFSFDNSFGMLIDETNGKIIGFYDADSNADSIDMQTFEINIGSAVTDITLDDLVAGIGGFIA